MAKKGFLSWLGFGRQQPESTESPVAEEQQVPEVEPVSETVAEPTAATLIEEPITSEIVAPVAPQAAESQPDHLELASAQEFAQAALEAEAVAEAEVEAAVEAEVEAAVEAEVEAAVEAEVEAAVEAEVEAAVEAEVEAAVEAKVEAAVEAEVEAAVEAEVEAAVEAEVEAAVEAKAVAEADGEELLPALQPETQDRPKRSGFFGRLVQGLMRTRENIGAGFLALFRGKKLDEELFEELETQLLTADLGVETTARIIKNLTQQASFRQLKDAEALYDLLKQEMTDILLPVDQPLLIDTAKKPYVILMVGVNGVGKTTTIGKLAKRFQMEGKSVMLAAGDTFRAAAVEQLQVWGQRNQIPVIAQHTGADSASVIFDAIQAARARNVDVLIADTAGRLQNKGHLMEELKKIVRVMKKLDEAAPHEVMLTLDAGTGQNALSQAKLFGEAVGINGIALTKLDGTAKGGVIFAVADKFGIPIRYIGVGEGIEDLRPFQAQDFIEALFSKEAH